VTGNLEPSPRKVLHTFQVIHNENLWDRNSIIKDVYSFNKSLNVACYLFFFSKKKPGSITEGTEKRLIHSDFYMYKNILAMGSLELLLRRIFIPFKKIILNEKLWDENSIKLN
jgi:hypothetical protein